MIKPPTDFPKKLKGLFDPWRFKVLYGGRDGIKSWSVAQALLVTGANQSFRTLCAREMQESIKQSVHQLLKDQIDRLRLHDYYLIGEAAITGRMNKSVFTFAGLAHNVRNIKSLESYDRCWVEEAANVSRDSWETLIPTLRKEGSEIWVTFNPKYKLDDTYKRFILKTPPKTLLIQTNWRDNAWLSEVSYEALKHIRRTEFSRYLHIYEGECDEDVEGSIYGKELKLALEEGRITTVPYNRRRPVDTIWDLGFGDDTFVWFVQPYDGFFNFIDCYGENGLTITDHLIELQNRKYLYGTDFLPYDAIDTIIHKKLAGTGDRSMSIEMIMRAAGRNVRIVPKVPITDRINAGRTIMPQCRFDADKCADGLQLLRRYQWGPPNEHGVTKSEPLHNEASHAGEAFTRAGQAVRMPKNEAKPKPRVPGYLVGGGRSGPDQSWMS